MKRSTGSLLTALVVAAWVAGCRGPETRRMDVTVMTPGRAVSIEGALVQGDALWIPAEELPGVTGFRLEPEGLCAGELCVPVPAGADWLRSRGEVTLVRLDEVARQLDRVVIAEPEHAAWSVSAAGTSRTASPPNRAAPDFALPDRLGRTVRLSDFRGRKVLLLTWASW